MQTTNYGGVPGLNTPIEKAPRACDSEGLHIDTNSADFASHGPIQQAPDGKAIANQIARLALASEINEAHAQAIRHAGTAIDFAKQAGALLLQVKNELAHGEFLPWLEANCTVSDRQARRYMASAQGKPLPIRSIKNDTMLLLPGAVKSDTVSDLEDANQSPNQQVLQQEHDAKRSTVAWKTGERALKKLEDAYQECLDREGAAKADTSICLKVILSKKLYVHGGYKTFEEYCRLEFGWSPEEVEEIHADAFIFNMKKGKAVHL